MPMPPFFAFAAFSAGHAGQAIDTFSPPYYASASTTCAPLAIVTPLFRFFAVAAIVIAIFRHFSPLCRCRFSLRRFSLSPLMFFAAFASASPLFDAAMPCFAADDMRCRRRHMIHFRLLLFDCCRRLLLSPLRALPAAAFRLFAAERHAIIFRRFAAFRRFHAADGFSPERRHCRCAAAAMLPLSLRDFRLLIFAAADFSPLLPLTPPPPLLLPPIRHAAAYI